MKESLSHPYPQQPEGSASRMGTATAVLTAAEVLIENNSKGERGRKWSQILGMFQGNPPYSTAEHRATASRWQANFNTMIGRGMLASACTPYYNLFEAGPVQAVIKLKGKNTEDAARKSRVATKHFQWLLKEADISDAFYRVSHSFVGFGRGFWYWIHPYQWVPEVRAFYEVLFPEGTSTNARRWEWVCVRDSYDPCFLWSMKGLEGWNSEAINTAIRSTLPRSETHEDWMEYQTALAQHSLSTTATAARVDVVICLVKESNGKWSIGIVARHNGANTGRMGEPEPQFLYQKRDAFDSITDVLCPFIYDTANGQINGCEGLGSMIYATVRVKDRMTNNIVNGGMLRSLTVVRPNTANAQVKAGLTVIGGVAILPPGFEAQPGTILTDINGPLTVDRHLMDVLSRTSGVYLASNERPVGNPDTATEAQMKFQQQTTITASGVNRFYNRLDTAWDTLYRRVLKASKDPSDGEDSKLAKQFVSYCEDEGVTFKELEAVMSVNSYRVGGGGSSFQRQQNLFGLSPVAGAMPARGKQRFFEDLTSATAGPDKVDEYFPVDVDEPGEAEWEANVENVQANAGSPPLFTPNQSHEGHVKVHIQALMAGLQGVQQGAAPEGVYAFGQMVIPHTGQHLQAWSLDPTAKEKVKAAGQQLSLLSSQYQELVQVIRQRQEAAAKQQEAAAIAAGQDPDIQLKSAKAQAQIGLKAQKQEADLGLAAQRQQAEMAMDATQRLHDMRLKEAESQQKQRLDAAKAAAAANKPKAQ